MNTPSHERTRSPHAAAWAVRLRLWRCWVMAALVAAALVACGRPTPPEPADLLDCQVAMYACSYADVDLAVIERSMSLAAAVADLLDAGGSLEDGLALLADEPDMASYGAGATGLVFRLLGGRPVVVDLSIDEVLLGEGNGGAAATAGAPGAATAGALGAAARSAGPAVGPNLIAGAGRGKSALVLSPFAFDFGELDTGGAVAGMLSPNPEYQGRVTYVASMSSDQPAVTIEHFLDLEAHDVVYVTTHGGRLCIDDKKKDLLRSGPAFGALGQDGELLDCRTDFLIQRFNGSAADLQAIEHVGIVLYQGRKHRSIAVTNDFFSHYYPGGLHDTLFVLVSCSTFAPDLNPAVAGREGVFVSWDGPVYADASWSSAALIENMLASGATVSRAMLELGDAVVDPITGGRLRTTGRAAGGDLRIVEVIRAEDALSGDDLQNAVEIELDGTPGDGQPDSFALEVRVRGAYADDAGRFRLGISVNDETRVGGAVNEVLQQHSEYVWVGQVAVNLGRDAVPGETLDIRVWVVLPEAGISEVRGQPRVAGDEPGELGTTWTGTLTWTQDSLTGGLSYGVTADVVFELDAGVSLDAPYVRYHLVGGHYTFTASGEDGYSCYITASVDGPLTEQPGTYLSVDMTGGTPKVSGFGNTGTPPVVANVACQHTESYTMEMTTNKTILYIPSSLNHTLTGRSLMGSYGESGASVTSWTWALTMED